MYRKTVVCGFCIAMVGQGLFAMQPDQEKERLLTVHGAPSALLSVLIDRLYDQSEKDATRCCLCLRGSVSDEALAQVDTIGGEISNHGISPDNKTKLRMVKENYDAAGKGEPFRSCTAYGTSLAVLCLGIHYADPRAKAFFPDLFLTTFILGVPTCGEVLKALMARKESSMQHKLSQLLGADQPMNRMSYTTSPEISQQ